MKALVIGGTGPTGPDIVAALVRRGYEVSVVHRGLHEAPGAVADVEHIHTDPHFFEPFDAALAGRAFDLIVATYGRMPINVAVATGRCTRFIGIGGNPAQPGMLDRWSTWPSGMRILARESDPVVSAPAATAGPRTRFAAKVAAAERAVLDAHDAGAFAASYIRYPIIIGRRTWLAYERGIVRRLLDGRRRLILPDGGLSIFTRCADRNAAALVAAVVDRPEVAAGQVYSCADDEQYSLFQWTQLIAAALEVDVEIVGVPLELARPMWDLLPSGPLGSPHTLVDATKARNDLGHRDVVRASEVLTDAVRYLVSDPGMDTVTYDGGAEDAILEASDELGAALAARLGWENDDDSARFRSWHPYDHPAN